MVSGSAFIYKSKVNTLMNYLLSSSFRAAKNSYPFLWNYIKILLVHYDAVLGSESSSSIGATDLMLEN